MLYTLNNSRDVWLCHMHTLVGLHDTKWQTNQVLKHWITKIWQNNKWKTKRKKTLKWYQFGFNIIY